MRPGTRLRKNEEIKARVDHAMKAELGILAYNRDLDVSDLLREAVRDFLAKEYPKPVSLQVH